MAIPTRAQVDVMIRERLATDPDRRATLLADPRAALSGLIGVDLPGLVAGGAHPGRPRLRRYGVHGRVVAMVPGFARRRWNADPERRPLFPAARHDPMVFHLPR